MYALVSAYKTELENPVGNCPQDFLFCILDKRMLK